MSVLSPCDLLSYVENQRGITLLHNCIASVCSCQITLFDNKTKLHNFLGLILISTLSAVQKLVLSGPCLFFTRKVFLREISHLFVILQQALPEPKPASHQQCVGRYAQLEYAASTPAVCSLNWCAFSIIVVDLLQECLHAYLQRT